MKANRSTQENGPSQATLTKHGPTACLKRMTQIEQARATIFAESRGTLEGHERLLGLALNEAEALAWETGFPHLVFPTLALEKVQGVAAWASHQRSVRRPNSALLRAA